jgi:putative ABC transport system permease protein
MTSRTLIFRSLRYRWRAHLGVVLGAAVGSAALIGALIVGDSVRESLREMGLRRLGEIRCALASGDRFFRAELADSIGEDLIRSGVDQPDLSCVLQVPGIASVADGSARANRVQILGVEGGSLTLGPRSGLGHRGLLPRPRPDAVCLNEPLARQLRVEVGDTIVLRLQKPSLLSLEAPISPQSDRFAVLRLKVAAIVPDSEAGNFSLSPSQVPPLNAFVSLGELQKAAGLERKANLLVAGPLPALKRKVGFPVRDWVRSVFHLKIELYRETEADPGTSVAILNGLLGKDWQLADAELELRKLTNQTVLELSSPRIFLEPAVERAVLGGTGPGREAGGDFVRARPLPPLATNAQPILTYFVNLFRAGTNTAPYSMVTAAGPPWTPAEMRDDEILVNDWLADDLRLKPGDSLDLTYFLPDSAARLIERTNTFRVRDIVPVSSLHADRTLMPEFPGLAKAESTHDWDAGFPLVHKIREKDEAYWKQHRGTPKAFVTLAAGRALWGNRFGALTAVRFSVPSGQTASRYQASLAGTLLQRLRPSDFNLRFEPVRQRALQAASQSQDFGGLFLGFSLFLIAAALILMALLFQFGLEQRSLETGTLLALGFTPRAVRRLLLKEGAALALVGGILGALAGLLYARLMLRGLTTIWRDAVGTSSLSFHAEPVTILTGIFAAAAVGTITVWLVLRKQARQPARELLAGEGTEAGPRGPSRGLWVALAAWAAGGGLVGWAFWSGDTANAGAFFGAGTLGLIGGLALVSWALARVGQASCLSGSAPLEGNGDRQDACPTAAAPSVPPPPTQTLFTLRACARRRKRSLAVAALLACGVFVVASISVFRLDANQLAWQRASGTGGFALLGQSTLPVIKDLNTTAGREAFGLDDTDLAGVSFVPFRVKEGDDASCLNLNRAQKPRLLGVKPELLAERGAFAFAKVEKGAQLAEGWRLLRGRGRETAGGGPVAGGNKADQPRPHERGHAGVAEIPAVGDAAAIEWALHKRIGDTLDFVDEQGRPFKVRLAGAVANSILQGSLVIDEAAFLERFPSEAGYRMFLVDAPSNRVTQVGAALSRGLQDVGLELTPAAERLAQFNAVQNTYLGTFQALGGLGLLLGSVGLGIVVLRNVLERRAELAVLLALGFRQRQVRRFVVFEHAALLVLGLAVGVGAALVAVLPALSSPGTLPSRSVGLTLASVLLIGLAAAWGASWLALRGSLLDALRSE